MGLGELVRCGLCGDSLNAPKTLQCFHSFCKACLQRLLTNDEAGPAAHGKSGSIVCPQCGHASQRVHIRNNNLLGVLAELHQDTGAELLGRKRCEYCDEADAEFRCLDCHTDLCANDQARHQRMPMQRGHRMAPLVGPGAGLKAEDAGLVIDQRVQCPAHPSEMLSLYCSQCEKLLCEECRGHETHGVEAIGDSLSRVIPQVKERLSTVDAAMLDVRGNRRALRVKKDRFIATVNDARGALERAKQEALARIDRDYEDLRAQIEAQSNRSLLPCIALEQQLGQSLERVRGTLGWSSHTLSVARGTSLLQELLAALRHQLDQLDAPPTYQREVEQLTLAPLLVQVPGATNSNVLGCLTVDEPDDENKEQSSPQERSQTPVEPAEEYEAVKTKVLEDEEPRAQTPTLRRRSPSPLRDKTAGRSFRSTSPLDERSKAIDTEYYRTGYGTDWRSGTYDQYNSRRIDDFSPQGSRRVLDMGSRLVPWREHSGESSSSYGVPRLARRLQYKTVEGQRFKIFCCGSVQSLCKVDERLWLPVPSENRIVVYSTSGTFCRTVAHPRIKAPHSVAADSYGNVLVAATSGLFVLRWSGELTACIAAGDFSSVSVCGSSAAALEWVSGLLYQLVFQGRQWLRKGAIDLHLDGEATPLGSEDTCLATPERIYVTAMSAGLVRRYTSQGVPIGSYQGVPFPRLCFADAEGSLVVADRTGHCLQILGASGDWYRTEPDDYKPCHAVMVGGSTLWVLGTAPGNVNLIYKYIV